MLKLSEETQTQIQEFIEELPGGHQTAAVDAIFMELMKVVARPRGVSHPNAVMPCHRFDVVVSGIVHRLEITFVYSANEVDLHLVNFREIDPWE